MYGHKQDYERTATTIQSKVHNDAQGNKERENDELDLGLQKTYVLFFLVGFCLGFSVFFDLGVLELRVEKKMRKKCAKKCARGTGDAKLI